MQQVIRPETRRLAMTMTMTMTPPARSFDEEGQDDSSKRRTRSESDIDVEEQRLNYNNSGSSSNSSLSARSLDSPSNSTLLVGVGGGVPANLDSDLEIEPDPPDWNRNVDPETLRTLSNQDLKRQEIINELIHTERSHVRNLKVLELVFHRPMLESQLLPPEQISVLFENLDEMLDLHGAFNTSLKARRRENPVVGDISDILLNMFDGPAGDNFQRAAATFCARQQIALEALKERRKKDARLNTFLNDAEGNPLCRRLQLKDLRPTGMQRLTKYPLLFESLAKCTRHGTPEHMGVCRAVERAKEILNHVNQAVREAEDCQRLADIQKRLDRAGFDKADHPGCGEFKSFDLTKHKLIHEGILLWRNSGRSKHIELHILLLDEYVMLLQKQDDKYLLKMHQMVFPSAGTGNDRSTLLSPIIRLSNVLVRENASDKRSLYLINNSQINAQMFELAAPSKPELLTWFKHINEAVDSYKAREGASKSRGSRGVGNVAGPSSTSTAAAACTPEGEKAKDGNDSFELPVIKESGGGCSTSPAGGDVPLDNSSSEVANSSETPESNSEPPSVPEAPNKSSDGGESLDLGASSSSATTTRTAMPPRRPLSGGLEPIRISTEERPLVQPYEVIISQRAVLTAEPVLTPLERLRRQDAAVRAALADKQRLVAEILRVPPEDFEAMADIAATPEAAALEREPAELALAAIGMVDQLTQLVNDAMAVSEEDVARRGGRLPSIAVDRLWPITSNLSGQLTQLLRFHKSRDEERERLRRELARAREQNHGLLEAERRRQLAAESVSGTADGELEDEGKSDPTTSSGPKSDDLPEDTYNGAEELATQTARDEEPGTDEFVDALCGDVSESGLENSEAQHDSSEADLEKEKEKSSENN